MKLMSITGLGVVLLALVGCPATSELEPTSNNAVEMGSSPTPALDLSIAQPFDMGVGPVDVGDQTPGMLPDLGPLKVEEPEYLPAPCPTKTLEQALIRYEVDGALGTSSTHYIAPTKRGGVVVALARQEQALVYVIDGLGRLVGQPINLEGRRVLGVATGPDELIATLIERADGALELVILRTDGQVLSKRLAMPAADRERVGSVWPDALVAQGRLAYDGSGWVAYLSIDRRWSDGKVHQGDTLRYFALDGTPVDGGWSWGCSHSMALRLGVVAGQAVPVCASDCYPKKGVLLQAKQSLYADDAHANCAGEYKTALAGVVPFGDGAWVGFVGRQDRQSADVGLVKLNANLLPGAVRWVTADTLDDSAPQLAKIGQSRLLAGWVAQGRSHLVRLDGSSGKPEGEAEPVGLASLERASDFVTLANGDVAWVFTADSRKLTLARVCRP